MTPFSFILFLEYTVPVLVPVRASPVPSVVRPVAGAVECTGKCLAVLAGVA